jgi:hypothetical protein
MVTAPPAPPEVEEHIQVAQALTGTGTHNPHPVIPPTAYKLYGSKDHLKQLLILYKKKEWRPPSKKDHFPPARPCFLIGKATTTALLL